MLIISFFLKLSYFRVNFPTFLGIYFIISDWIWSDMWPLSNLFINFSSRFIEHWTLWKHFIETMTQSNLTWSDADWFTFANESKFTPSILVVGQKAKMFKTSTTKTLWLNILKKEYTTWFYKCCVHTFTHLIDKLHWKTRS